MPTNDLAIRPLHLDDADTCDQIIASLPYHFGQEDGRSECAVLCAANPALSPSRASTWSPS
jgi:hypothetical protein